MNTTAVRMSPDGLTASGVRVSEGEHGPAPTGSAIRLLNYLCPGCEAWQIDGHRTQLTELLDAISEHLAGCPGRIAFIREAAARHGFVIPPRSSR